MIVNHVHSIALAARTGTIAAGDCSAIQELHTAPASVPCGPATRLGRVPHRSGSSFFTSHHLVALGDMLLAKPAMLH